MYDAGGTVIYVGKAKDLKKRLSSYFRSNLASRKTEALVALIAQIDVTVTHTETEALLLEHNYIKLYQPRYNVLLRDDNLILLFSSAAIPIRVWRCIAAPNMRRASILVLFPTAMPCGRPWRCCRKSFPSASAKTASTATARVPACSIRLAAAWGRAWRAGQRRRVCSAG
jgi:excinuclease ABC subunit C